MISSRIASTATITVAATTTVTPTPTAATTTTTAATAAAVRDGCYSLYSLQLAMFLGAQSV